MTVEGYYPRDDTGYVGSPLGQGEPCSCGLWVYSECRPEFHVGRVAALEAVAKAASEYRSAVIVRRNNWEAANRRLRAAASRFDFGGEAGG